MRQIKNTIMLTTLALLITVSCCAAQIKNAKIETVKVLGNCSMCKKNIEMAANKKHISKALWNETNKMAILTFDSTKTTTDAILKNIAYAGYDNQNYLAPDAAYNKLDQCCQYERKLKKIEIKQKTETNIIMAKDTMKKSATTPTEIANPLAAVYTAYFDLKDALTKDNGASAAAKANELYKAIGDVQMEKLTATQHTVWMKYEKKISYDAEHIKGVTETGHQREHFITLSKNMYEVIKVIKTNGTVYYDYCPMANNGKGANWLSLEKPIINPYFGKQMLTCGNVQETITK